MDKESGVTSSKRLPMGVEKNRRAQFTTDIGRLADE